MSTVIRNQISKKNPYFLEKYRLLELRNFCLQYDIWKKAYDALNGLSSRPDDLNLFIRSGEVSDPVARCAMAKKYYSDRIEMIEKVAKETDEVIGNYILIGVTTGKSYEAINAKYNIPCCKDTYYTLYRRFFWILNKVRE